MTQLFLKYLGVTHQHYKGGYYKFIGVAIHTETNEDVVVYEHFWPNKKGLYVRPKKMFFGFVKLPDGTWVRRFQPICDHIEKLEDKTLPMSKYAIP